MEGETRKVRGDPHEESPLLTALEMGQMEKPKVKVHSVLSFMQKGGKSGHHPQTL